MQKMTSEIVEKIREYSDGEKGEWTHYTYREPNDEWRVPPSKFGDFIHYYCNVIDNLKGLWDGSANPPSLAERNLNDMPVVFKFSLKFLVEENRESKYPAGTASSRTLSDKNEFLQLCPKKFLKEVIHVCQVCLLDTLEIEDNEIIRASIRYPDKKTRDLIAGSYYDCVELWIQFCDCGTDVRTQTGKLYKRVIDTLNRRNSIRYLPQTPKDTWEQMLNKDILTAPLLMYGSSLDRGLVPLKYQGTVDFIEEITDDIDYIPLEEAFNPSKHEYFTKYSADTELLKSAEDLITWLPLFFSVRYNTRITLPKEEQKRATPKQGNKTVPATQNIHPALGNVDELANKFLDMINPLKVFDTPIWLDIGRALYTTYNGSDIGRQHWINFTNKGAETKKIGKDENAARLNICEERWNMLGTDGRITIRTLADYARMYPRKVEGQDKSDRKQKSEFDDWFEGWVDEAMEMIPGNQPNEVAIAAYRRFWFRYRYGSSKTGKVGGRHVWHMYRKDTGDWIESDAAETELRKDMIDSFRSDIRKYTEKLRQANYSSDYDRDKADDKIKALKKISDKLGDLPYVDKIIRLMKLRFGCDLDFHRIFDSNSNLTKFVNGVVEVVDDDYLLPGDEVIVFRSVKGEDYLSMSTKIRFPEKAAWDSKEVKHVHDYLNRMHTNPEVCKFVLQLDASIYQGGNRDKIIVSRVGVGNNSKSGHQQLLSTSFGDYFKEVGNSILTGSEREANSHSDEEAYLRNAKIVVTFEPSSVQRINTAKAKALTGNDRKYVRAAYGTSMSMEQTYKTTIFANSPMRVTEVDKAIVNRMLILWYQSTFSDAAPKDEAEQWKQRHFPSDLDFNRKIKAMAPAYAWILFQEFKVYKSNKYLMVPDKVRQDTQRYWEENDTYNLFINQRLRQAQMPDGSPNRSVSVTTQEVFNAFSQWYIACRYDKGLFPDLQRMIDCMKMRIGETISGRWIGYQLIGSAPTAPVGPVMQQAQVAHGMSLGGVASGGR